jgi:hypothetical protein
METAAIEKGAIVEDDHAQSKVNGDHQVLKPIGKGKFAVVNRAQRKSDNLVVALKRLNVDVKDEKAHDNYQKEVRLLQSLDHPNIIHYLDSFICDMRTPQPSAPTVIRDPTQFVSALSSIHEHGFFLIGSKLDHWVEFSERLEQTLVSKVHRGGRILCGHPCLGLSIRGEYTTRTTFKIDERIFSEDCCSSGDRLGDFRADLRSVWQVQVVLSCLSSIPFHSHSR